MKIIASIIVSILVFTDATTPSAPSSPAEKLTDQDEDKNIINETLSKYGPPINYKMLNLPGPEFSADDDKFKHANRLIPGESGTFTLRIRTITKYFSYNGRYEESHLKKIDNQQIPIIKGQFGEHFVRKNGGYYIRTIGYTLDENGYKQFLIDLSMAQTTITEVERPVLAVGSVENKVTISSTALGTLLGGNTIG